MRSFSPISQQAQQILVVLRVLRLQVVVRHRLGEHMLVEAAREVRVEEVAVGYGLAHDPADELRTSERC